MYLEPAFTAGLGARYLHDIEVQPPLSPCLFWICLLFSSPASCFHLSLPPIPSAELSDNSSPTILPFKDTTRLSFSTADSLISPSNRLPVSYSPHCLAPLCSTDWPGNPPDFPFELVFVGRILLFFPLNFWLISPLVLHHSKYFLP